MNERFICGYRITVGPSIYTNRPGKIDVRIDCESDWGAKHQNGLRYITAQVLAAESFEVLRNYSPIQGHVLTEILHYARGITAQLAKETTP
ncbi:hypothetical protein [Acidithiobacillus caldus]|uniref:Uncharacterized protein n=1 Tax=Acidithiobacillus caldus TaxID=33059 RepID=A0A1E7Z100_9PROT|nr:hypothetical protein [Acidithiobacillus caldus]OFC36616.1 hypothetical protein BAE27_05985 [Acidithiobacillus caldus]OFC38230.1 hypothetical protein BAE29_09240 [Acidithiobacillus caldus]OFC39312.1 hypothetical protein BAE28_03845 [Acidithiobacillus caldus]OFC62421.1 hypothetical protein BAE30_02035 [Acidithiobacillus caldus]